MNTKFNVGDTVYIPGRVISIKVNNAGVFYKVVFHDGEEVPEKIMLKIPDDLYIEIQERLNQK